MKKILDLFFSNGDLLISAQSPGWTHLILTWPVDNDNSFPEPLIYSFDVMLSDRREHVHVHLVCAPTSRKDMGESLDYLWWMWVLCIFFWLVASWQGHWLRPAILPSLKRGHLAVIGMRISSDGCGCQTPASVEVKLVVCWCVTSASQEGKGDVFHPDLPSWPTCSIPWFSDHHRQLWPLPLWTILCLWLSLTPCLRTALSLVEWGWKQCWTGVAIGSTLLSKEHCPGLWAGWIMSSDITGGYAFYPHIFSCLTTAPPLHSLLLLPMNNY